MHGDDDADFIVRYIDSDATYLDLYNRHLYQQQQQPEYAPAANEPDKVGAHTRPTVCGPPNPKTKALNSHTRSGWPAKP